MLVDKNTSESFLNISNEIGTVILTINTSAALGLFPGSFVKHLVTTARKLEDHRLGLSKVGGSAFIT